MGATIKQNYSFYSHQICYFNGSSKEQMPQRFKNNDQFYLSPGWLGGRSRSHPVFHLGIILKFWNMIFFHYFALVSMILFPLFYLTFSTMTKIFILSDSHAWFHWLMATPAIPTVLIFLTFSIGPNPDKIFVRSRPLILYHNFYFNEKLIIV